MKQKIREKRKQEKSKKIKTITGVTKKLKNNNGRKKIQKIIK